MSEESNLPQDARIRWLHLSDFHFDAAESWDRRRSIKALLEFLAKRKLDGWQPDLVFATGDFANRGKRDEFDQAILFFKDLAKTLELDLADFFVVPGNHDVDRGARKPAQDAVLKDLLGLDGAVQQERIAQTLGDSDTLKFLGGRLSEYYFFTERLLGPARRTQEDKPWRVDIRKVGGLDVAILQLNSVWASGADNDKGNLLVGSHQVEQALTEASAARVRFALIHHPWDYLPDGDASYASGPLERTGGAHFLLRGHLHDNKFLHRLSPDGQLIELAAGAVYQGTNWSKRFLIGQLDLAAGTGAVEFLVFSEKGFWTVDTQSYGGLAKGCYLFDLPSELSASRDKVRIDPKRQATRERDVRSRFRVAVAAVHGQMRFIGFPAAAAGYRPNVAVHELFVPLRLSNRRREASEKKPRFLSTMELLDRLQTSAKQADRIVVLGEPGSGKTTLCRFAAVFFAGGLLQKEISPLGEPLPLFLPFRDFLRRRRDFGELSIVDYLLEQAHSHLQVGGLDKGILEEALIGGNAILLLDGLDEVGLPQERVDMRDRVLAFCSQHSRVPVIITSRFAGYDEAPLPEDVFTCLELGQFEDEDLEIFVKNWYSVQEPTDPDAREQGIARLVAALATEPKVRALARNPLLATLIALVHRTEAQLPGERAKLYELVVRTLLETWPSLAGRHLRQIDVGLQRTFLEDFALIQQESRSDPSAEVSFERAYLVEELTKILARQRRAIPREVLRRIAEEWVEYLAAGTGVIVEQQPGSFSFLHLSLLEFLAACALDRQVKSIETTILNLQEKSSWQEVLLLVVGRHATDLPFLDRLFAILAQRKRWLFLLLCLREEAAFDDDKRLATLDWASKEMLELLPYQWEDYDAIVRTIERFSIRHSTATKEWRRARLGASFGPELISVIALGFGDHAEIQEVLESRTDTAFAAELLEFWPRSWLGSWAAARVTTPAALHFFEQSPPDLAPVRAIASLSPGVALGVTCGSARAQLLMSASQLGLAVDALEKIRRVKELFTSQGETWENPILRFFPNWPKSSYRRCRPASIPVYHEFSRDFALDFSRQLVRELGAAFEQDYARLLTRLITEDLVRDFSKGPTVFVDLESNRYIELARIQGRNVDFDHFRNYFLNFSPDMVEYLTGVLTWNLPGEDRARSGWPVAREIRADRAALNAFLAGHSRKLFNRTIRTVAIYRTIETWIALATTARVSVDDSIKYLGYRLQNIDLLQIWPSIDRRIGENPEPERLALYLQLGWTQATTTHEWPATDRWIAVMNAGPPEHWMPAAQWHLCWLLADRDDAQHQIAFNAALRQGLADEDPGRHAVAETLKQVIGFY